jgi:hypothetical protein
MKVLAVCVVAALLIVSASALDADSDKPRKSKGKKSLTAPAILKSGPSYFMPRHRVVIVPKGDPRAYAPGTAPSGVSPLPVSPVMPAAPQPMSPVPSSVLKSGAATSTACRNLKGTCIASSSCSGDIVRGICPGAATITCCTPKGSQASSSACPVYQNAGTSSIKGNGGKMYSVVRIAAQHFTGSADNTMTKPTACAFGKMAEAASKAGIRLTINSGFRTYERQVYFWNCYKSKKCNNGNLAATPGTSNHGFGYALDINTGATSTSTYKWMASNASRFGFRRTVPSEPWHWEFR